MISYVLFVNSILNDEICAGTYWMSNYLTYLTPDFNNTRVYKDLC